MITLVKSKSKFLFKGFIYMIKQLKKLGILTLVIFSLSSCLKLPLNINNNQNMGDATDTASVAFEKFCDDYLNFGLENDQNSIIQLYDKPEKFGFTDYKIGYTLSSFDYPTAAEIAEEKAFEKRLNEINKNQLSLDRMMMYDILKYDFALLDEALEFFYYYEPLKNSGGIHRDYPLNFCYMNFFDERDLEDYFSLLGTSDIYFQALMGFENKKIELGLFMNDSNLELVLKECADMISERTNHMVITTFNTRIDSCSFLSDEKKTEFKEKNKNLFETKFVPAYQYLIEELGKLRGKGVKTETLKDLPKGQKYYNYLLKSRGLSKNAQSLITDSYSKLDTTLKEYIALSEKVPASAERTIGTIKDPNDMIKFWKEKTAADFPKLPGDVTYGVYKMDKALESMPIIGFYLNPQVDNYINNNVISYNERFLNSGDTLFFTLAHEGFPGHLQQFVTVYGRDDLHTLQKIQTYLGNLEGWAEYVELYSAKYVDADDNIRKLSVLNNKLERLHSFLLELGISYEGWTLERANEFNSALIGRDMEKEEYLFYANNPGTYSSYTAGYYEVADLYEHLKLKYPKVFSDLEFHTEYLRTGSMPFPLLKTYMEKIFAAKSGTVQKAA